MSYKVIFDAQKIYDSIQKSTDVALYEIGDKIIEDTEPFVPKKTGVLRQSATVERLSKADGIEISYERVLSNGDDITSNLYAGLNSKGTPVQRWTTQGTGGYWLEKSEAANLPNWVDYFRERTKEIWRKRKSK